MVHTNVWHNAKDIQIQTSQEIDGGFSLGFDDKLPEETKAALTDFAYWVEDHYPMPVTLWVDFKYNHYLLDENKQRVPYKFYYVNFETYPVFLKEEDIPVIELAAREERASREDLLKNFICAITHYFAWMENAHTKDFTPCPKQAEAILRQYLDRC